MVTSRATCVGVFRDRGQADAAVDELRSRGFGPEDMSVVARGREGADRFGGWDEQDKDRTDEHDVGPGEGAVVGGVAGLLIGAGLMLIPGVGPIFAVGPLAAALAGAVTGAAAGAATGGIAAGLIHLGVSEEEATYYESRVGEGAYLVTVNCTGRYDEVIQILRYHGAEDTSSSVMATGTPPLGTPPLDTTSLGTTPLGATPTMNLPGSHNEGRQTVELGEEERQTRGQPVEPAEVRLGQATVSEPRPVERLVVTSSASHESGETRRPWTRPLNQLPQQMQRALPALGDRLARRDQLVQSLPGADRFWPAGALGLPLVGTALVLGWAVRARTTRRNRLDRAIEGLREGTRRRRPPIGGKVRIGRGKTRVPRPARTGPVRSPSGRTGLALGGLAAVGAAGFLAWRRLQGRSERRDSRLSMNGRERTVLIGEA